MRGNEGNNRLVGTSKGDTNFIDSVDGREDFVGCGRLESPNAGGFDTDTAIIDEIDVTVECENEVVSSPSGS